MKQQVGGMLCLYRFWSLLVAHIIEEGFKSQYNSPYTLFLKGDHQPQRESQWHSKLFSVTNILHGTLKARYSKTHREQNRSTYRVCSGRGKEWRLFFKTRKGQLNDQQNKIDVKRGRPEPLIYMVLKGKKTQQIGFIVFPTTTHRLLRDLLALPFFPHSWMLHSSC